MHFIWECNDYSDLEVMGCGFVKNSIFIYKGVRRFLFWYASACRFCASFCEMCFCSSTLKRQMMHYLLPINRMSYDINDIRNAAAWLPRFCGQHAPIARQIRDKAGASRGVWRYIYTQIHRSVKSTVNHSSNWQSYMHKQCAICLFFVQLYINLGGLAF